MIADFWMAVGALRESFVRRWVARVGERPREVKVSRSEERGALEGVGGGTLSEGFPSGWGAVVEGLEEKREETTSAVGLLGSCLGRDMVDPSSFCLLAGCVPLVSGSLTTVGTALLPVKGPDVWIFSPWYRALFFAVNRSLQRPPLKTVFAPNIPSPMDKFISMPSSAMVVFFSLKCSVVLSRFAIADSPTLVGKIQASDNRDTRHFPALNQRCRIYHDRSFDLRC